MLTPKLRPRAAMLLVLTALLTSCATPRSGLPPRVMPPETPPLSPLAKMDPDPVWCVPTCSEAWSLQQQRMLRSLVALERTWLPPSPSRGSPTTSAPPSTPSPVASSSGSATR